MSNLRSSESVSIGHPDKVCDQISDAIVDAYLAQDPASKIAVESLITHQNLILAGEVNSKAEIDAISIAKGVLKSVGYQNETIDFNPNKAKYQNLIHQQSTEINQSVADGGAGDQGHVFGYATNETSQLLPLPYVLATDLMEAHEKLRKTLSDNPLLPDAKCQVSVDYENHKPIGIRTIVLSSQHKKSVDQSEVHRFIKDQLILPTLKKYESFSQTEPELILNPSGAFTKGGPYADTGLTGRKIIVDAYGGFSPHGGGAFSGKDATKIDRSAAYAARYLAKQVIWAGLADRCLIEIAYAIGKAQPVAFSLETFGTGLHDDEKIAQVLDSLYDLSPKNLIKTLGLDQPIFSETAKFGHFTNADFPWEQKNEGLINEIHSNLKA